MLAVQDHGRDAGDVAIRVAQRGTVSRIRAVQIGEEWGGPILRGTSAVLPAPPRSSAYEDAGESGGGKLVATVQN